MENLLVPAICENQKCRTVFLSNAIGGVGTAIVTGSRVSPCPKCGGYGKIPDGQYTRQDAGTMYTPRTTADLVMLQKAMRLLQRALATDMPHETFIRQGKQQVPELQDLFGRTPEGREERRRYYELFLATVVTVLMVVPMLKADPKTQVEFPSEFYDALRSRRDVAPDAGRKNEPKKSPKAADSKKKRDESKPSKPPGPREF